MMPLGADMAKAILIRAKDHLQRDMSVSESVPALVSCFVESVIGGLCCDLDRHVRPSARTCKNCQANSTVAKLSLSRRGSLFSLHY
jgi:hypothetical protein